MVARRQAGARLLSRVVDGPAQVPVHIVHSELQLGHEEGRFKYHSPGPRSMGQVPTMWLALRMFDMCTDCIGVGMQEGVCPGACTRP